MRTTRVQHVSYLQAAALAAFLSASLALVSCGQPGSETVSVDNDDLGGVVSSTTGPEAGVWVIAETADLPTKFVKIVVTDDGGRYLLPDLPEAAYDVWVRGYGLVDSPKVKAAPGETVNLTAAGSARCSRGGAILPVRLLVFPAPGAGQERVSRHGAQRQRYFARHDKPGSLAAECKVGELLGLSWARYEGNAGDPRESWDFPLIGRCVGAAHSFRTGRRQHGQRHGPDRREARI